MTYPPEVWSSADVGYLKFYIYNIESASKFAVSFGNCEA